MTMLLWPGSTGVRWERASLTDVNTLLAQRHYLGPVGGSVRAVFVGIAGADVVAAQVWKLPTSRRLPSDGTWLELARWCLTPEAGPNAGSRMHAAVVHELKAAREVTTLVSYSDPSQGHTGSLYRACNWTWRPTWMRLRTPPSGGGSWDGVTRQAVKDRWVFEVRRDQRRDTLLAIQDASIVRRVGSGPLRWQDFFGPSALNGAPESASGSVVSCPVDRRKTVPHAGAPFRAVAVSA